LTEFLLCVLVIRTVENIKTVCIWFPALKELLKYQLKEENVNRMYVTALDDGNFARQAHKLPPEQFYIK
jgi:hypothetical protein